MAAAVSGQEISFGDRVLPSTGRPRVEQPGDSTIRFPGRPTSQTKWAYHAPVPSQRLGDVARRAVQRRVVEAAIWGMPAVNYQLMYQEMVRTVDGGFNQVLYWSRLLDWRNQTLTPNPDVIYLMPFFNTQDVGPVVLEIRLPTTESSTEVS